MSSERRVQSVKRVLLMGLAVAASVVMAANTITIDAAKVKCPGAPDLWGIFLEDIDLSLDGGLYAELVRNRSFEDGGGKVPEALKYWQGQGGTKMEISSEKPHSAKNPHSLKVEMSAGGALVNEGYFGMAVREGVDYKLSLDVRGHAGRVTLPDGVKELGPVGSRVPRDRLTVALETPTGKVVSSVGAIEIAGADWQTRKLVLKGVEPCPNAKLVFRSVKGASFFIDCVSLFPSDTYGKSGIFRKDLMEKLLALQPRFMRFPGGGWVRGRSLATAYRWKETIGNIWDRRTQDNLWGYWSTHGIGFHEYLLLCEELHAKPLYCINPGVAMKDHVPMEKMDEFVQEALDCIEYANGPVTSKWGALRAAAGHPEPFNLEYLQLGNEENSGKVYAERYDLISKAVRAKYPNVKLVWCYWRPTRTLEGPRDIRDDHIYASPDWCFANSGRYGDPYQYDREELGDRGIFLGEYAVLFNVGRYGDLRSAIAEAALMTGMEYASDVVKLAAYAPLFAHLNHLHWAPNLIYHNAATSFNHPSYEVQKLFAENRGKEVLITTVDAEALNPAHNRRVFGFGSWVGTAAFKDLKIMDRAGKVLYANALAKPEDLKGWKTLSGNWIIQDGALVQTEKNTATRGMSIVLDREWQGELTCTFKAKRMESVEGFLALYHQDPHNWVNFGGCDNKVHVIEGYCSGRLDVLPRHLASVYDVKREDIKPRVNGAIEKDRWYEVKLEFQDGALIASLDGKRVTVGKNTQAKCALVANGVVSEDGKYVIAKVVNYAERAMPVEVAITNAKLAANAQLTTYTGPNAKACNSLENPHALKPVVSTIPVKDGKVQLNLPPLSLSIIRIER